jgi:hypothetical protein
MYFQIVNQNKLKFNFSGFILKKKYKTLIFFVKQNFLFKILKTYLNFLL